MMALQPVPAMLLLALGFGLLPAGAQEVTLPLDRYEQLRARANPTPTPTPAPPVPAALEEARLEVTVGADSARVVQELTLSLNAAGWQQVPLAATGSLIAADLGALEGRVAADKGWSLVVRGQGRHRVRLESLTPVAADQGATRPTWTLTVALPEAAVVGGVLRVDPQVQEAELLAGGVARGRDERGGWRFVGLPGAALNVQLLGVARAPERSTLPLRFTATTATRTLVTRTRRTVSGWVEARVVQGALEELRLPLPAGLEVVSLGGDPVAGWDVANGVLVVTPLAPVSSRLAVTVSLTGDSPLEFRSPVLAPTGAQRTQAFIVAAIEGDGLLELADPEAGRLADPSERNRLPPDLVQADPSLMAVPDPGRPPSWKVSWADASQVLAAQVDRLLVDVLVGEVGQAAYQVWAEVRSSGAVDLTVTPPAGFQLTSAGRDAVALTPGLSGSGLVVPLAAGEARQVVHVAGLVQLALPAGDGTLTVPLPALSAPASRVEVRVVLPGGRRCEVRPETRSGSISGPPRATTSASGPISKLAAQAGGGTTSAASVYAPQLWPRPAGFAALEAAWSALSNAPDPLAVEVKAETEREEWF
jgi:hypothetical protein